MESETWIIGEVLYFGDAESESELDRVGLAYCNWEFEDDFIFVIPGTEALHIWLVHWMY